jgi:DNA-binding transcriptional regulator GbsR (MarR family)
MVEGSNPENGRGHHPALQTVHDSMLDGLGQLSDYFGFSKVMGQLYGALLLYDGPMSLDDLMERLSISKASVSMNMRTLEHMGMVRQVWVRGRSGRRKYYEAETDFVQIISNILSGREMRDVDRALSVMGENHTLLSDSMSEMADEDRQVAELYLVRISQIRSIFRFAQLVITGVLARVSETDMKLDEITHIDIH